MSAQTTIVEHVSTREAARRSPVAQIERFDRLIEAAELRLSEQEAYVRNVARVSGSTAVATFELQKMHLLIALLREGRERLVERLRVSRERSPYCAAAVSVESAAVLRQAQDEGGTRGKARANQLEPPPSGELVEPRQCLRGGQPGITPAAPSGSG